MSRPFEFTGRIRSFKYAFYGISHLLRSQHNAWIHALATILVLSTGLYFHLTAAEWCWIVLAITSVWTAEALNTAFELLADAADERFSSFDRPGEGCCCGRRIVDCHWSVNYWPDHLLASGFHAPA